MANKLPLIASSCWLFLTIASWTVAAHELTRPWVRHTIDNSSRGADGVRLADMNNDGLPDVATGWEEGGITRVYQHPGVANVCFPWPAVTVGKIPNIEDAVWVDLDGDGRLDVVSSCEGKTPQIFVHWSPTDLANWQDENAWRTQAFDFHSTSPRSADGVVHDERWNPSQQWMFALPLDVDGRNGVDLVVGSKGKDASVGWLESPRRPRDLASWRYHHLMEAGWIMSLRAIDMDGDSDFDVLLSDRRGVNSGVRWLENPGTRTVLSDAKSASWRIHEIAGRGREVLFLDLASSRKVDSVDGTEPVLPHIEILVAVKRDGLLRVRRKSTTVNSWQTEQVPWPDGCGSPKAVAIGDVNLDGNPDVVFTCEEAKDLSGVRWMSEQGDGWQDHEISGITGTKFDRIELIDLDEDGDLDVMTCEERENLGVIWYENPIRSR